MLSVQRRAQMTLAEVLAAATQRRLIIFGNQNSRRAHTGGGHGRKLPSRGSAAEPSGVFERRSHIALALFPSPSTTAGHVDVYAPLRAGDYRSLSLEVI